MLAKWVWRFGREVDSLRRRVIVAKYKVDDKTLIWNCYSSIADSSFIKGVRSLYKEGSNSATLLEEGMRIVIGSGTRVDLWTTKIWDDKSLKDAFPRCHALAMKKKGCYYIL